MIKQGPLKYQWYHHESSGEMPEVLFDLGADPTESRNLAEEPAYKNDMKRFRARRVSLGYRTENPTGDNE